MAKKCKEQVPLNTQKTNKNLVVRLKCMEPYGKQTQFDRQNIATHLQRECKQLVVKVKRLNVISHQLSADQPSKGTLNRNTRSKKNKMEIIHQSNKGVSIDCDKPPNPPKESEVVKPYFRIPSPSKDDTATQTRQFCQLDQMVLTPECREKLKQLSLNRSKVQPEDPNTTQQFEISHFSPVRNSTVFEIAEPTISRLKCNEIDLGTTAQTNGRIEKVGNHELSKKFNEYPSRKILTDKPNLIKQLLFSDDSEYPTREDVTNKPNLIEQLQCSDEDSGASTEDGITEKENQITVKSSISHKFFNRIPDKNTTTQYKAIKNINTSKKSSSEAENVFEFLSSSQEKRKHTDPARDIIERLISEGKVRVATIQKGTGRPVLKPRQGRACRKKQATKKRQLKAAKPRAIRKVSPAICGETAVSKRNHQNITIAYFDDAVPVNIPAGVDTHTSDERFSTIATSVLVKGTNKCDSRSTSKKDPAEQFRLLDFARKFVSTPVSNRKYINPPSAVFSPVQSASSQALPTCPSPWRVNDEAYLPSVFNFTKNKSNLPTCSSDYIPPTPKKQKLTNNSANSNDSNVTFLGPATTVQHNSNTTTENVAYMEPNDQLEERLGPSIECNAENLPPPASTPARLVSRFTDSSYNDENAEIFDLKFQKSHRTYGHRSPLKPLNILEMVILPPWQPQDKNEAQNVKTVTTETCVSNNDRTHNVSDLFGFDEFIDKDDTVLQNTENVTENTQSVERSLHNKLKELKKWRPKKSPNKMARVQMKPMSRVFDDNEGRPKQQLIKEMLCSTMINTKNADNVPDDNSDSDNIPEVDEYNVQPDFFNDFEPETTLEKKRPHKTYGRQPKRKRKIRHNFVVFLDSDEYNSDSDDEQQQRHEGKAKNKRHKVPSKGNTDSQLKSFVNEFNSMCKEVEGYELVVE